MVSQADGCSEQARPITFCSTISAADLMAAMGESGHAAWRAARDEAALRAQPLVAAEIAAFGLAITRLRFIDLDIGPADRVVDLLLMLFRGIIGGSRKVRGRTRLCLPKRPGNGYPPID